MYFASGVVSGARVVNGARIVNGAEKKSIEHQAIILGCVNKENTAESSSFKLPHSDPLVVVLRLVFNLIRTGLFQRSLIRRYCSEG